VITTPDLRRLDETVERALATNDESALHVLGYGEISSVLAWPEATGPHACKRLPIFDDESRYEAFRTCFHDYLAALTEAGVTVHDSRLEALPRGDGRIVAYCVQPVLDPGAFAPALLRSADRPSGRALLGQIVGYIATTVRPTLGIDAQLSNWATSGSGLVYIDITTPLLRDAGGRDLLDTELFMASLPAVFRPIVRRFMVADILDPYFAARPAALDLAGNLHKEDLADWVGDLVAIANERLGIDLDVAEVRGYYRSDARRWALLQRARRVDRTWQRRVRRRAYPYLLPGHVDRRLSRKG
jgi:hypothetical protein